MEQELKYNREKLELTKDKIASIRNKGNTGTLAMQHFELRLKKDRGGFMDKMDPLIYITAGDTCH